MRVLRRRAVVIAVVVVVVAGAAGAGWVLLNRKPALPSRELAAYLEGWPRFDVAAMQRVTAAAPPEMAEAVTAMRDDLRITAVRLQRVGLRRAGENAVAEYAAQVDLAGLGTWTYDGTLDFRRPDGKWQLAW